MPSFYLDRQQTFNTQIYVCGIWTHQRSLVQLPTHKIGKKTITKRSSPIKNCSNIPRLQGSKFLSEFANRWKPSSKIKLKSWKWFVAFAQFIYILHSSHNLLVLKPVEFCIILIRSMHNFTAVSVMELTYADMYTSVCLHIVHGHGKWQWMESSSTALGVVAR